MLLCNSQPLKNLYTILQIRDNKQHISAAGCLSIIEVRSFFYRVVKTYKTKFIEKTSVYNTKEESVLTCCIALINPLENY